MERKIIRTAQGKIIDLDELRLRNKHVIPIGNVIDEKKTRTVTGVNDTVATGKRPKSHRRKKMREGYAKDIPVVSSIRAAKAKEVVEETASTKK